MGKAAWISLVLASVFSAVTMFWLVDRKRRVRIPDVWRPVGKIDKIVMYPLKGGALRLLSEADCAETGLVELPNETKLSLRDRCFVMYDLNLKPLKLVACSQAVRISVESVDRDTVLFSAPNAIDFRLKLNTFLSSPRKVKLSHYNSTMEAVDCGNEISKWISRYLLGADEGYRFGYFLESVCRRRGAVEIMKADSKNLLSVYRARQNDSGFFADMASYMIISTESVQDVNDKLPVDDRFDVGNLRPNIVVNGCEAYAEDNWDWIKIGEHVVLKRFKPCTRCLMVTINPYNGEANKNLQPFKLLKTYRTVKQLKGLDVEGNSPIFGAYAGLYIPGRIKLGDPVYISI